MNRSTVIIDLCGAGLCTEHGAASYILHGIRRHICRGCLQQVADRSGLTLAQVTAQLPGFRWEKQPS